VGKLMVRLFFLGTSSGQPTVTRNTSSLILQFDDGRIWLFDCGEGKILYICLCF
jgi:ribonuclease BN (tRNA processing enzyme)